MKKKRRNRRKVAKPPGQGWRSSVSKGPQLNAHKFIYLAWGALFEITLCLGGYFDSSAENRVVYSELHNLQPLLRADATHVVFTDPIELKSRRNLQVSVFAPVDNSWAWVGGDFINEESGTVYEYGSSQKRRLPDEARSSGGIRSYGYWHDGYQGGK